MIDLQVIIKKLAPKEVIGEVHRVVDQPIQLDVENSNKKAIMWASDKNYEQLQKVSRGVLICSRIEAQDVVEEVTYLIVENPRSTFRELLNSFYKPRVDFIIANSAIINADSKISKDVAIGENTVIESGVIIGSGTVIGHNNVIKTGTVIGSQVNIGSNNVIGGVGFGYEQNEQGDYEFMPHIGNVVIKDGVDIGNCTTIDRAVMGSTLLSENVKVDNLVHIAHGVKIGRNSLIIANAMVAGSVVIGENVWVAPSASILNKKSIGDNAIIGMGCVVLKTIDNKAVVVGNPGKIIKYLP